MLWQFVVIVLVIWVVQRRWQMRRQLALARKLNTNLKTWPILGHAYMFLGSDEDMETAWENVGRDAIELGGVSKFMLCYQLFACIADPAVAQLLLNECLDKHVILKTVFKFALSNSSIIAPVPIWRHLRKTTAAALNSRAVAQFTDTFSKYSTVMVDLLERELDKDEFSLLKYISEYSMNAICESTMGVKISDKKSGNKFMSAIKELFQVVGYIVLRPWFHYKLTSRLTPYLNKPFENIRFLRDFVMKIIVEKRNQMKTNSTLSKDVKPIAMRPSFLVQQLEAPENERLSEEDLLDESITLVVAGFDSTANTIGFVVLMLTTYPDVQDKVYEELQEMFGDSDRAASHKDLSQLKYLEAVIKETLRLYPTAPIIFRHVHEDIELQSGLTLVKGCGILINIWAIHRNPSHWGADADQFRPERFLDNTPRHPAAFMPFSYGIRNCVGHRYAMLSIKSVVSTLLRRYRVLAPRGVPPGTLPGTKYNLLLKHVDNYPIRIQRRK